MKICRNSVLTINRTAGTGNWTLPSNFDYVKYVNSATASEYTASSTIANIYPTNNTAGYTNLQNGALVFNSYLNLSNDNRPQPVVNITATDGSALTSNQICVSGSIKVNATSLYGTTMEYNWQVYSGSAAPTNALSPGTPLFSSSAASPTFGAFNTDGTYIVRLQVREQCCGWSIPAFATLTVKKQPSAPTSITFSSPVVSNQICVGTTNTASTATGSNDGVIPYTYEWDYDNGTHTYGAFSNTAPSFTAQQGNNLVKVRVQEVALWGCAASPTYEATVVGIELPIGTGNPVTQTICSGVPFTVNLTTSNAISGSTFTYVSRNNTSNTTGTVSVSGSTLSGTLTNTSTSDQTTVITLTPVGPAPTNCPGANFTVSVVVYSPVTATATSDAPVCEGSTLNLSATPTGGSAPFTYAWTGPGGFTAATANPSIASTTPAMSGIYSVTLTDARICSGTASTNVVINPLSAVGAVSADQLFCMNSQPIANITIASSTGTVQWQKSTDPSFATGVTNIGSGGNTLTPAQVGTVSVKTYIRAKVKSGVCAAVYSSNITLNVIDGTSTGNLATTSTSRTCNVFDASWHYFRNTSGEIIAAINSNGQNLGDVTIDVTINPANNVTAHSISYSSDSWGNGGIGHGGDCYGQKECIFFS
jgi:hypothetical protein